MPKISELPAMDSALASGDYLPLVDISEGTTVKITIGQLMTIMAFLSSTTRRVGIMTNVTSTGVSKDISASGYESTDSYIAWAWGYKGTEWTHCEVEKTDKDTITLYPDQDVDTLFYVTDLVTD
jgi:hypothetical protein